MDMQIIAQFILSVVNKIKNDIITIWYKFLLWSIDILLKYQKKMHKEEFGTTPWEEENFDKDLHLPPKHKK